MADYLRSEKISSCVLHGIDPNSGVLGRDLDLHIPDLQQAFRAAVHFSEILRSHGVRWISLMHPIWGPRCIGIQEPDLAYWELHVIPKAALAWVDFGNLFPIKAREGPYGFNFDPCFWFIKTVLQKHSRSILRRSPLWTAFPRDLYIMANQAEIESEFQRSWRNGAEFIAAVLGPDTDANLRERQSGIISLMSTYFLSHPWNAARNTSQWLFRKADVYKCPTVPIIGIDTTMESSVLQDCLKEKFKHAFIRVVVADRPMAWHIRRMMQDGQKLLVFRRDAQQKSQDNVDNWISIPTSNQEDVDSGAVAILDCVVQYNERWRHLYPANFPSSVRITPQGCK
jgi:hypothetical protein